VSELGNLMQRILLSLWRMSTVKIRSGSLFRTPRSRIQAEGAGFGETSGQWPVLGVSPRGGSQGQPGISLLATDHWPLATAFSSFLHRPDRGFTACAQGHSVCHLREAGLWVQSQIVSSSRREVCEVWT
jgi:hypothetical protein